jgi:hypothetical protein
MKPRGLKKVLGRRRQKRQKGSKKAKIRPVVRLAGYNCSWVGKPLRRSLNWIDAAKRLATSLNPKA